MKKLFLLIFGTMAFIVVVGLLAKNSNTLKKTVNSPPTVKTVKVGATSLEVEVADTEAKRSLGLGKRDALPKSRGMLFVFPQKQTTVNFWMKDMRFPIDIIWIANGKVVKIDENVQAQPNTPDSSLKIYTSPQPIDYVLEVNAGFSDQNNISARDSVDLSQAL